MSGVCRPSRSVGGDWYDYIEFPDGRVAIVLADVSGKGMAAALLMSSTRSILRLVAQDGRSPSGVLAEVNRTLVADLPASRFITMIYAVLDPARRTVRFANAGHHPPVLVDGDGARVIKAKAELPLGVRKGSYSDQTLEMTSGSRLFLYSDGVVEARNRAKEEYGEARLLEFVGRNAVSAEQLLKDVLKFTGSRTVQDDITIVAIGAPA
jgi:sigma-B regulation protein RsbU (phosphoserine phosphatase)